MYDLWCQFKQHGAGVRTSAYTVALMKNVPRLQNLQHQGISPLPAHDIRATTHRETSQRIYAAIHHKAVSPLTVLVRHISSRQWGTKASSLVDTRVIAHGHHHTQQYDIRVKTSITLPNIDKRMAAHKTCDIRAHIDGAHTEHPKYDIRRETCTGVFTPWDAREAFRPLRCAPSSNSGVPRPRAW